MNWIKVKDKLPQCGNTILIILKDNTNGITIDNGKTCDISWIRTKDNVFISTSGNYKLEEIEEWCEIS